MRNTDYKFTLYVETPDGDRKAMAFNVAAYLAEEFKPYDLCSDAVTAIIAGGVTGYGADRIDAEREKLAADISRNLTRAIMKAIKADDKRNGYDQ